MFFCNLQSANIMKLYLNLRLCRWNLPVSTGLTVVFKSLNLGLYRLFFFVIAGWLMCKLLNMWHLGVMMNYL